MRQLLLKLIFFIYVATLGFAALDWVPNLREAPMLSSLIQGSVNSLNAVTIVPGLALFRAPEFTPIDSKSNCVEIKVKNAGSSEAPEMLDSTQGNCTDVTPLWNLRAKDEDLIRYVYQALPVRDFRTPSDSGFSGTRGEYMMAALAHYYCERLLTPEIPRPKKEISIRWWQNLYNIENGHEGQHSRAEFAWSCLDRKVLEAKWFPNVEFPELLGGK